MSQQPQPFPGLTMHYVPGKYLEWKSETLEIVVVQAMEVVSSHYDILNQI